MRRAPPTRVFGENMDLERERIRKVPLDQVEGELLKRKSREDQTTTGKKTLGKKSTRKKREKEKGAASCRSE